MEQMTFYVLLSQWYTQPAPRREGPTAGMKGMSLVKIYCNCLFLHKLWKQLASLWPMILFALLITHVSLFFRPFGRKLKSNYQHI